MPRTNPAQWREVVECRAGSWYVNRNWINLAVGIGVTALLAWMFLPPTFAVYGDFRLHLDGQVTTGSAIRAWYETTEDDEGNGHSVGKVEYQFRTPDGRTLIGNGGESDSLSEELDEASPAVPVSVQVEYCRSDPTISRWAGAGPKRSPLSILVSLVLLGAFTAVFGNGAVQYTKQLVLRWVPRGEKLV